MAALDIHVENLKEKDFEGGNKIRIIKEIIEKNIPVALSFSPWQEPIWKDQNPEIFELFKITVQRNNSVLGQQGLNHKCKYLHKLADPWHENYCIWNEKLNYEEQRDFMLKGKEKLENLFSKDVELYAPPNHQFDETTLEAAVNLGYKFFADKAMIFLKPYKFSNMLVVPERDLEDGKFDCASVYIHYDEIDGVRDNYNKALENAASFKDLQPENAGEYKIKLNEVMKYSYKFLRDGRKVYKKLTRTK